MDKRQSPFQYLINYPIVCGYFATAMNYKTALLITDGREEESGEAPHGIRMEWHCQVRESMRVCFEVKK